MWATPYYVPPETVEGYTEDFRSDIYAFGATLYHALAGKPPCDEESMATDVLREAKKKVVPLSQHDPSISAATCSLVERAMAYNPDDRFGSYDELLTSLTSVLRQVKSGHAESSDTAAIRRAENKHNERQVVIAVSIGVVALLAAAAAALSWIKRPQSATSVVKPPPIEVVAPPPVAATDTAVAIMKSYREAREAVTNKNFSHAAEAFILLHNNPAVQEPTRTWAGVEAILAAFLAGNAPDACKQALATAIHMRVLLPATNHDRDELIATLEKLSQLPPLPAPQLEANPTAPRIIAAMLAALKNWEQGMPDQAAACLTAVVAAKLPDNGEWIKIYQDMASDYLVDYQLLSSALFSTRPADKTGCEKAISDLEAALVTLKTQGRAKFNVRAWQLDLTRQAKLLDK